ncbi:MAG: IS3 family transposase [Spirochaetes bacterium]|nr:IS3 family transposase [Spirochaetota bacterium]
MRYQMIQQSSSHFKVTKMCRTLGVSRSGYYAFLNRPESERSKRHKYVLEQIRIIHRANHEIYGSPNITAELRETGIIVSRGQVARLMRKKGIRSKVKKKYKATTDSKHNLPVAENILNREFKAERLNQKWVSDITYLWTDEGWLYLAGILDLFDGAIVGWSMDKRMKKDIVINALNEACRRRRPEEGLILHSDRGSQYCSKEYQKMITRRKFVCSMSRKGNCWDNAPMESFWGKLKTEWIYGRRFKTREEARRAVFEYIELFYNRKRRRSVNGYIAPLKFGDAA